MTSTYIKTREPAAEGSIPDRLQMFTREVRFYEEVAQRVGVRVPALIRAEVTNGSTLLELEDLSSWREGADPAAGAAALATLHRRWSERAVSTWSWLPRADVSDLVEALFDSCWPSVRERADLPSEVRIFGDTLVGNVTKVEAAASKAGPQTLTHGDPSAMNMRTSASGEVALLDWEDVGSSPGICDIAWFLLSSVDPDDWDTALAAYGDVDGLTVAMPAVVVQGLLSLSDHPEGSSMALGWVARLDAGISRL